MDASILIAMALAVLVGVALGLLGGGGSVLTFTAFAIGGPVIGTVISRRLSTAALRTGFGVLVMAVGVTMLGTAVVQMITLI